jgi:hypothetical protein
VSFQHINLSFERYKKNKATSAEILALCDDLKVLGKGDFKKLLKWRTAMIEYKQHLQGEVPDEKPKVAMRHIYLFVEGYRRKRFRRRGGGNQRGIGSEA